MKLRIKPDPKIKNFLWPKYKTGGAAAFDIYLQEDISLRPGEPAEISLGFSTEMDPAWPLILSWLMMGLISQLALLIRGAALRGGIFKGHKYEI